MKPQNRFALIGIAVCLVATLPAALAADRVKTANGILETDTPPNAGVRSFKGIPFAQPPVGDLRWREPQPVKNWTGVRNAGQFGPRCMQRTWPTARLLVPRQRHERGLPLPERLDARQIGQGEAARAGRTSSAAVLRTATARSRATTARTWPRKGMVAVSVNYRTNIFGFFAHPELTKESPHHASGNYGLLDQVAALAWVQQEHRGVRRRSEARDHRRRIGRVDFGQRADGFPAVAGT